MCGDSNCTTTLQLECRCRGLLRSLVVSWRFSLRALRLRVKYLQTVIHAKTQRRSDARSQIENTTVRLGCLTSRDYTPDYRSFYAPPERTPRVLLCNRY